MKTAVVLSIAGLAAAQGLGAEPACAIPCLTSVISAVGCQQTDIACQCGPSQAAIAASVAPCLESACPGTLLASAASVGLAICSSYTSALGATSTSTSASSTSTGSTTSGSSTSSTTTTASSGPTSSSNVTASASPSPSHISNGAGYVTIGAAGLFAGLFALVVAL